jgi:hypothetical protein
VRLILIGFLLQGDLVGMIRRTMSGPPGGRASPASAGRPPGEAAPDPLSSQGEDQGHEHRQHHAQGRGGPKSKARSWERISMEMGRDRWV